MIKHLLLSTLLVTSSATATEVTEWCDGLAVLTERQIDLRLAGGDKPELPEHMYESERQDLKTALNTAHDSSIDTYADIIKARESVREYCLEKYND